MCVHVTRFDFCVTYHLAPRYECGTFCNENSTHKGGLYFRCPASAINYEALERLARKGSILRASRDEVGGNIPNIHSTIKQRKLLVM